MKTTTATSILTYIHEHTQATAKELAEFLNISPQALFRQLAKLQERGELTKIGSAPKVFYTIPSRTEIPLGEEIHLPTEERELINRYYLHITPLGERMEGVTGFEYWTSKTGQPLEKTAHEYATTIKKYEALKEHNLINATSKLKNTFPAFYLDALYYIDFYSIERFGKTKLGQMLLYAKQSQNKKLMKEIITMITPPIMALLTREKIDAIAFIPPTVKREVQFMKVLQESFTDIPGIIPIVKIKSDIMVPQKTLSKLKDRIENAQKTMLVHSKTRYHNILLIDDAVGSGATLNETAGQIRQKHLCTGNIYGLAITGSLNGFDVISEV